MYKRQTVIAVLPIIAVLIIGFAKVGPGTLLDLSLALFIGMVVGAFSSVFIATLLLVQLRRKDGDVVELDRAVEKHHERSAVRERTPVGTPAAAASTPAATTAAGATAKRSATPAEPAAPPSAPDDPDAAQTVTGRKVHKYAQSGPRNQPRKQPRSKR